MIVCVCVVTMLRGIAQQVVAGLLQQDVVVSFIRAVGVVVVPDVSQAVH